MWQRLVLTGALMALTVLGAACGNAGAASSVTSGPAAGASSRTSPASVGVASSKLGQILVDASGRTLYLFEADKGAASTCYSACARAWPPLLTIGNPNAGPGASASLLGTTTRSDGQIEVTYAGHPLYSFVADKQAGDTSGQGINDSGGLWYVISPAGGAITPQTPPAVAPSAPPAPQPATATPPAPSSYSVSFSGLAPGTYPVHLHSACNGSQSFHIAVLQSLVISPGMSGSIAVSAADFGRGWCLIVYSGPSLASVLTVRRL